MIMPSNNGGIYSKEITLIHAPEDLCLVKLQNTWPIFNTTAVWEDLQLLSITEGRSFLTRKKVSTHLGNMIGPLIKNI